MSKIHFCRCLYVSASSFTFTTSPPLHYHHVSASSLSPCVRLFTITTCPPLHHHHVSTLHCHHVFLFIVSSCSSSLSQCDPFHCVHVLPFHFPHVILFILSTCSSSLSQCDRLITVTAKPIFSYKNQCKFLCRLHLGF